MQDYSTLVRLGWNDYARTTKAERSIAVEYPILKLFSDMLPKNSRILDVGCGSGKPIAKYLSDDGFDIEGFDISEKQIEKAKYVLKNNKFSVSNIINYDFENKTYDALICLHSLEHIERIFHGNIIKKMYSALKPGGVLLISSNTYSNEGVSFLNPYIQMFYSHFDQFEMIKYINSANFQIIFKNYLNVFNKKYLYLIAKKEGELKTTSSPQIVYKSLNSQ